MVELVNTNNLGLFDREIVQVQVLFPLVDLFYINPQALSPWTLALSLPPQACKFFFIIINNKKKLASTLGHGIRKVKKLALGKRGANHRTRGWAAALSPLTLEGYER